MMIFGILQGGAPDGIWGNIANFTAGDAPFVGGFAALIGVAMVVGFSFQGTELIGVAAGDECQGQRRRGYPNPGHFRPVCSAGHGRYVVCGQCRRQDTPEN